ncbi:antibiotic biosynthesis monooxygenase family protein [Phyllobacterium endophyticum]|uniref:Antibiotic biosynthesis monooxygenase n=1 Tax=Phyllobacterium endophyticum TaxID=1149773 RepID=A0A2P7AU62_9HYPH|nr:antibiotic biosynthesis monooxygenase [Phyllobacterium endophyticum]MBB3234204.1 heme-degrading monooxygenase HmoA [Phyllobacterium endophyticum]PSH57758.1 antibiotic biosynthesis monooxygenase [Phyllobacterium endophyticum]TYR43955.1 antibiotic biosynthesis monooxygenase [Phyllobacterium endophyticum]
MIAVIFEVEPAEGRSNEYFDRAADLKPLLETIDGFISIERFRSLANENRYLSLSFWRDEASVAAWRQTEEHRLAQRDGRTAIFADYRLRIASVIRDYGLRARDEAPLDARVYHHA